MKLQNSPKVKKAIDEVFKKLMAMSKEEFEAELEKVDEEQRALNEKGELSVGQMIVGMGMHSYDLEESLDSEEE